MNQPVLRQRLLLLPLVLVAAGCGGGGPSPESDTARVPLAEELVIPVFDDNMIHFNPDEPGTYETVQVGAQDNGKVLVRQFEFEPVPPGTRILAEVTTRPVPLDPETVHDKWDRAGNLRLARPGEPEVEIVKFITAYGGETSHTVDVTQLAPLFRGTAEIRGFVNTWSSPGWEMDARLRYVPDPTAVQPTWAMPLFHEPSVTAASMAQGPLSVEVVIPQGLTEITLHYLTSGHCTDGRGKDEFETTDHVIRVNGRDVHVTRPWRDDCKQFRAINPYCKRWSDGSWSSDYSRSGWCPGDAVLPETVDLSEVLSPGAQRIEVVIDDIRPRAMDDNGNPQQGYWRVSAYLTGR